jgi:transcriptional regulator GlxA family with amidase domain
MNPPILSNASNHHIPATVPSLIDAALAAFDADRDASRRYLLCASVMLGLQRAAFCAESTRSDRGGLLAWQLKRVVDYIEAHLTDRIAAVDLAALINVSTGKLYRAFKISVGVTPFRYIGRRRLELACTMIRTTREPLSQIALACGVCDQAHLCKLFRRLIGTSPSDWRRQQLMDGAVEEQPSCRWPTAPIGDGARLGSTEAIKDGCSASHIGLVQS